MLRPIFRVLLVVGALFALMLVFNASQANADGPDFSNVNDILNGRRTLLPMDDIVVTLQPPNNPVSVYINQTRFSGFGDQVSYEVTQGPDSFVTRVGRMFYTPYDVTATFTTGALTLNYFFEDQFYIGEQFPLSANAPVNQDQLAIADFTGDGLMDFAYLMQGAVYVVTALDTHDVTSGIFISSAGNPSFSTTGWTTLTAGDFNGDGTSEIALASAQSNAVAVEIFTVTPVFNTQGNLVSINLAGAGSAKLSVPNTPAPLYITAGNFAGLVNPNTAYPYHQLALLYEYAGGVNGHVVALMSVSVTAQNTKPVTFALTTEDTTELIDSQDLLDALTLTSGYVNVFGETEQIIAGYHEFLFDSYIAVLTLNQQYDITTNSSSKVFDVTTGALQQIALGNFDQDEGLANEFDLELAAVDFKPITLQGCGLAGVQPRITIYQIDAANNFALSEYDSQEVGDCATLDNSNPLPVLTLTTGDTQGRSLLLGPPSRVVAQHIQPAIVLEMPPMHVDYIAPYNNNTPTTLNLSAVPLGFFASYQTAVSTQKQSSHTGTTSYTNAITEATSEKVVLGIPDEDDLTLKTSTSATQMWKNSTSKTYTNFDSISFNASTQTGFDDQLWYNSERQNIYIYPVIGQYGCPTDNPNCSGNQQVPLTVMFSGPDQIFQTSISGSTVEWYQPLHEPGNALSYPANLAQLQRLEPNMNLLTADTPTQIFTDDSTSTEQANWSGQQSQNVTSGSAQNYSWKKSISISFDISADADGLPVTGSGSFSFSYSGSKAISTLNSSTTTLGQATGIGINKPGTFPIIGEYQYPMQPFIFGTNPVTGTVQTLNVGTQIQTNGFLRAAFTADPTDPQVGSWWQTAYYAPDIALNHPSRWNVQPVTGAPIADHCLPIGPGTTTLNCATFNAPDTNIWNSEFHHMKGFFITPIEANGEGPQIDSAVAGQKVLLETRVYNYSTTSMQNDEAVVVQFYVQPWDPNKLQPIGKSVLIDNVGIGPIPGFNDDTDPNAPLNYAIASTVFDTTPYSNQYLLFWVLVVPKDQNGNPVTEMAGHGLTGIPPQVKSIAEATTWTEPYSNNLGVYKSLFHVTAQNTTQNAPPAPERLRIDALKLSKTTALLNEKVIVSTNVHADHPRDDLLVTFYRGDPDKKGTAFDVERLSHIDGGDFHRVQVIYRPTQCGNQNLFARVTPTGGTAQAELYVTINPRPVVRDMLARLKQILPSEMLAPEKRGDGMLNALRAAQKAFKQQNNASALAALEKFRERVTKQSGDLVPSDQADIFLAQTNQIFDCVKP
jgi:hypothetical protein